MLKNKVIAVISAVTLIISAVTVNASEVYSDVSPTHWAYAHIIESSERGIFGGYEDGTFRPDENITYQEFVKAVVSAVYDGEIQTISHKNSTGGDINIEEFWANRYEAWAQPYLDIALEIGIIEYDDTDFAYGGVFNITREKAAKVLARASTYLGIPDIEDVSAVKGSIRDFDGVCGSCKPYVEQVIAKGIMNGYGNQMFCPSNYLTRAEMATVFMRMLEISQ